MEYIYAALLLHKLNKEINEDGITKVVEATGITPDKVKVKAVASALSEVNIEDALKSTVVPTAPAAAAPASDKTDAPAEAADDKKPEKDEKKEEEALEGLSSLFG